MSSPQLAATASTSTVRSMPSSHPPTVEENVSARTIVLCFDGTGNMFGENSNVIKFFRALVKDRPEKQLVYYQPGIGTYNERQFYTRSISTAARLWDKGLATHLNDHVKEGYQFIMRNYRRGDKISLFGFSRGAHTARVIAGMLYKVGLLPAHNDQQLDFAFSVYQSTGSHGIQLSKEFKQTFAIPVTVEFVGVWDTVSSVGIIPRSHPYTSVNYAVKTFRHALALDERRARFRPQTWNEPTPDHQQDLDVDDPGSIMKQRGDRARDDWVYQPPERRTTDVKEVWFAGAHADVGGGSHPNTIPDSLSGIPLRWMVKECIIKGTDILFNADVLTSFGFDLKAVTDSVSKGLNSPHAHGPTSEQYDSDRVGNERVHPYFPTINPVSVTNTLPFPTSLPDSIAASPPPPLEEHNLLSRLHELGSSIKHLNLNFWITHPNDALDRVATVFDQLKLAQTWWLIEFLPTFTTYQEADGTWVRKRMRNFGQGRYIPFFEDEILVHKSVEDRIKDTATMKDPYRPAAFNWDLALSSGMIKYVS